MAKPTSDAGSLTDPGLPIPLAAALDEVEARLLDTDAGADPAERSLADDVTRYALGKARDPISRALLSRPTIVAWCVNEAVRRARSEPRPGRSTFYRTAEPLTERAEFVEAPPRQAERTRRSRGGAKEKKS